MNARGFEEVKLCDLKAQMCWDVPSPAMLAYQ